MKKLFTKTMLLLCVLMAGSGTVWAETKYVEISPAQALNDGGVSPITITCAQGDGTSAPAISSGQLRLYQAGKNKTTGNTIAFSSEKTITSIVFTFANSMTASNGSFSVGTYDSSSSTWTGSTTSVTLTVTGTSSSTRIYITAMKVYYEDGSSANEPSISLESTLNIDASEQDGTLNVTYNEIDFTITPEVVFYESDGETVTTYDWIEASINSTSHNIEYQIEENTDDAIRTAYLKVYGLDEEANYVYSNLLTITQAKPVVITNYTLVTSITPGKHYIFVGYKNNVAYALGKQNSNNRAATSVTVEDGTIKLASDVEVNELLIMGDVTTGYYTIFDEAANGYLYAACGTGTSNYMRTETELDEDGNGTWVMSVNDEGVASIKAINASISRPWMRYNGGSTLFSCYQNSDSQSDIYLFERVGDENIQTVSTSISNACTDGEKYYGTYSCPFAFTVPTGVTVSEISVSGGKLQVSDYSAGAVVPANTGVMIASSSAGAKTLTLGAGGSSVLGSDNMLKPSSETMTGNCLFYRLTMHNGTQIGFWWGAEDGAAFSIAANKAYLAVPTTSDARSGFSLFGDESNGIAEVEKAIRAAEDKVYDLQGRRIGSSVQKKGLYIVNGKKVMY